MVVLNIVFAGVAGVAILAALYYGGRAIIRRGQPTDSSYNVGRQQARRAVQIDLIRAITAIVVALIFLGAFGLTPQPTEPLIAPTEPSILETTAIPTEEPEPDPAIVATPTVLPTSEPVPPVVEVIVEPSSVPPTAPPAAPTEPPPVVETAVVSSGVGVWLRANPSTTGEQLEWLLDGTVLTLLAGQETADSIVWQQVETVTGVAGWVAQEFILLSE